MKVSQCARCKCSVPLLEWRLSPTGRSWKHIGPLRDGAVDRYVEPDGVYFRCNWVKRVPVKV